jgi:hypothetical protein
MIIEMTVKPPVHPLGRVITIEELTENMSIVINDHDMPLRFYLEWSLRLMELAHTDMSLVPQHLKLMGIE